MNAVNTLPYSSSPPRPNYFSIFPLNSFSVNRRHRRRRHLYRIKKFGHEPLHSPLDGGGGDQDQSLKLVLDVNQLSSLTSSSFRPLVSAAYDAYYDLRTLISVDVNNRVVFSCRRSTVHFAGAVFLCGFAVVLAFRVLARLGSRFRAGFGAPSQSVVVRRDRSLGGKEVIVGRRDEDRGVVERKSFKGLENPLSDRVGWAGISLGLGDWRGYRVQSEKKLPKWWPNSVVKPGWVGNQEEYQRDANRLVRAITDSRTSGKDVMEHDIIQLRRICRTSGVQVSFDTTNTRDSFYRASVNFILNVCSSAPDYSFVQIDGEGAEQFVAGLAENIGLENTRAARMVSAAVAARTRACFLQAWALEVQGKHSEAVLELSKICLILRIFPSEESSPEMEMVARGLGKNLKVEQRKLLMDMFVSVCGEESHRCAADALGLMFSPKGVGDQQDSKHTGN